MNWIFFAGGFVLGGLFGVMLMAMIFAGSKDDEREKK